MSNALTGLKQTLAVKKAASWGTAVACVAGDGIQFLSGQAKRDAPVELDNSRGQAFAVDGTPGAITCSGAYGLPLRYAGADVLIAMMMGIAGVPTQQAATTAYANTYKWAPDVYGKMVTIAKRMIDNAGAGYIEEIPTAKVTGITITGEVGAKPLQVALEVAGTNREIASATNTIASFGSVTVPTEAMTNPVMFSHLAFRLRDVDATALSGTDLIYPSKFTLAIKRNLKGEYTGQYRTTGANPQDMIDEPTNENFPEIQLTLEFPTHTAATWMTALGNDARKKCDIVATAPGLAGVGYYYKHTWQFPHLQLLTANPTDSTGRITEPLTFRVIGLAAASAGMAGITDPLWWGIVNKRTTDPLA